MKDIFDDRESISKGFFHYTFWIMGWLMFSTCLITLFMKDFGIVIPKAQWEITAICTGLGIGILLCRTFVIAVNDIKSSNKTKLNEK